METGTSPSLPLCVSHIAILLRNHLILTTLLPPQARDGTTVLPSLDLSVKTPRQGSVVPSLVRKSAALKKWKSVKGTGYSLYRVSYPLPITSWSTDFDVSLGTGKAKVADEFKSTGAIAGNVCVSIAFTRVSSDANTTLQQPL
jgi:hypothetical protein